MKFFLKCIFNFPSVSLQQFPMTAAFYNVR